MHFKNDYTMLLSSQISTKLIFHEEHNIFSQFHLKKKNDFLNEMP